MLWHSTIKKLTVQIKELYTSNILCVYFLRFSEWNFPNSTPELSANFTTYLMTLCRTEAQGVHCIKNETKGYNTNEGFILTGGSETEYDSYLRQTVQNSIVFFLSAENLPYKISSWLKSILKKANTSPNFIVFFFVLKISSLQRFPLKSLKHDQVGKDR